MPRELAAVGAGKACITLLIGRPQGQYPEVREPFCGAKSVVARSEGTRRPVGRGLQAKIADCQERLQREALGGERLATPFEPIDNGEHAKNLQTESLRFFDGRE